MTTISITTNRQTRPSGKITDRVKTFEDACEVLGIDGDIFTGSINDKLSNDADSVTAYLQLIIIARALNEGWQPDWGNSSENKYVPWFNNYKSGSGLSFGGADGWTARTGVGSRLCFKSRELAQYAGTQFLDLYNKYLLINN